MAAPDGLLRPELILQKILDCITEPIEVDVGAVTLISDAAEHRLLNVLSDLSTLAEHRTEPLSCNPDYCQLDDTKRQLQFVEAEDRRREERRKRRELQQRLWSAKNKKEKMIYEEQIKELQQKNTEEQRQKRADETALAALGVSKPKFDREPQVGLPIRPRRVRVSVGDLHALAARDPLLRRSHLMDKLSLGGNT